MDFMRPQCSLDTKISYFVWFSVKISMPFAACLVALIIYLILCVHAWIVKACTRSEPLVTRKATGAQAPARKATGAQAPARKVTSAGEAPARKSSTAVPMRKSTTSTVPSRKTTVSSSSPSSSSSPDDDVTITATAAPQRPSMISQWWRAIKTAPSQDTRAFQWHAVVRTATLLFVFGYLPVSSSVLDYFSCSKHGDEWRMDRHLNVKCYEGEHADYLPVAIVLGALIQTLGVPAFLYYCTYIVLS